MGPTLFAEAHVVDLRGHLVAKRAAKSQSFDFPKKSQAVFFGTSLRRIATPPKFLGAGVQTKSPQAGALQI